MNLTLSGVSTDLSLTYSLANELAGARYTVVHTPKGISSDPILVVGQTMATSGSLTKLSTVLVVNEFVNGLKTIADRFLGQPNTATTRMSMQSTMQNFVTSMIQQRKIAGGNVSVTTDPGNVLNGVVVNAQLRAFAEIETVSLKVQFSVVGGELEQA
jgi:predicted ATP-grasp superfamily ATP-dependent carboligase